MKQNQLYLWMILIITILFFTYHVKESATQEDIPKTQLKAPTFEKKSEKVVSNFQSLERIYQKELQKLTHQNDSLKNLMFAQGIITSTLKAKNKGLILKLKQETDTTKKLKQCDSLADMHTRLLQEQEHLESLHLKKHFVDELRFELASSQLDSCRSAKYELAKILEKSIEEQKTLEYKVTLLEKRIRRQKQKNKMVAFGALVLTSVTTSFVIRSSLKQNP